MATFTPARAGLSVPDKDITGSFWISSLEISKDKVFAANAGSGANIKKNESKASANFLTR
jgi:hypothetical protein